MIDASLVAPDTLRPLSRSEYDRMVEVGLFQDEHVELLQGALVRIARQTPEHADVVRELGALFVPRVGTRAVVQLQLPFAASDDSEPEPDLALIPPGDYRHKHPTEALLVIEVADASRRKDRSIKSDIYAKAGIPEYWVIDLQRRVVEVRTAPVDGEYSRLATYSKGNLHPTAFPDIEVDLDLLLR